LTRPNYRCRQLTPQMTKANAESNSKLHYLPGLPGWRVQCLPQAGGQPTQFVFIAFGQPSDFFPRARMNLKFKYRASVDFDNAGISPNGGDFSIAPGQLFHAEEAFRLNSQLTVPPFHPAVSEPHQKTGRQRHTTEDHEWK